jgi:hypothetical protein
MRTESLFNLIGHAVYDVRNSFVCLDFEHKIDISLAVQTQVDFA